MEKTRIRAAAALFALTVLVAPAMGRANPITSQIVQCKGVAVVAAGEARCEQKFELASARFPSDIESHANFHARTATGTVIVEWFDFVGTLQARITCNAPGLYVAATAPTGHTAEGGPADLSTYPSCERDFRQSAKFVTGMQTLVVRATTSACWSNDNSELNCPFHGYLVLDQQGIPG